MCANDVIVETPLPEWDTGRSLMGIDEFGRKRLEIADDLRKAMLSLVRCGIMLFINYQNAVEMVRHDAMHVQQHVRVMRWQCQPDLLHNGAQRGEVQVPIHDFPQNRLPILHKYRDEVGATGRIIVTLQTQGILSFSKRKHY
jgi:hypothetical protein